MLCSVKYVITLKSIDVFRIYRGKGYSFVQPRISSIFTINLSNQATFEVVKKVMLNIDSFSTKIFTGEAVKPHHPLN